MASEGQRRARLVRRVWVVFAAQCHRRPVHGLRIVAPQLRRRRERRWPSTDKRAIDIIHLAHARSGVGGGGAWVGMRGGEMGAPSRRPTSACESRGRMPRVRHFARRALYLDRARGPVRDRAPSPSRPRLRPRPRPRPRSRRATARATPRPRALLRSPRFACEGVGGRRLGAAAKRSVDARRGGERKRTSGRKRPAAQRQEPFDEAAIALDAHHAPAVDRQLLRLARRLVPAIAAAAAVAGGRRNCSSAFACFWASLGVLRGSRAQGTTSSKDKKKIHP